MVKLFPRKDNILVIQRREKKSSTGLILLADNAQEANKYAEVLAVGPLVEDIKVGDIVYADISAGSLVEDNDDGIIGILSEDDILAIKEENSHE
jgi:co-chaperonin GroES (HSP10)